MQVRPPDGRLPGALRIGPHTVRWRTHDGAAPPVADLETHFVADRSNDNRPPSRGRRPAQGSPRAAAGTRRGQAAPGSRPRSGQGSRTGQGGRQGGRAAAAGAATRQGRRPRGRSRRFRWLPSWKVVLGSFLGLVALGLIGFYVAYRLIDIPQPNDFADDQTTIVYYSGGTNEMGRFAAQDRTIVASDQIPQHVKDAIVAAEDRTFYENRGVSPVGLARAVWGQVSGDYAGGGSTITQQYVKNYYLTFDQTYSRKAKEAIIALKIDQQQTKDETLTAYLNTIYFGRGAYGIQAAARAYFDKNAADLTVEEGALLAGIVPNPSGWDPAKNPEKATERFEYVLDGMVLGQTLSEGQRDAMVVPTAVEQRQEQTYAGPNGYLLAMVRSELLANSSLTDADLDTGGLRITTTISRGVQAAAIRAMNDPEAFPVEDRPATLHAALTSINPRTGGIVALYGGADYLKRQSNGATQDVAQAGSTFKPFTLVAALEDDIALKSRWNGRNNRTFDAYVDSSGDEKPVQNFGGSQLRRDHPGEGDGQLREHGVRRRQRHGRAGEDARGGGACRPARGHRRARRLPVQRARHRVAAPAGHGQRVLDVRGPGGQAHSAHRREGDARGERGRALRRSHRGQPGLRR